ncbi:hypothetical protein [Leptospira kirschneri]|nr:hypothetical protein [Leptospira kirschneri]
MFKEHTTPMGLYFPTSLGATYNVRWLIRSLWVSISQLRWEPLTMFVG